MLASVRVLSLYDIHGNVDALDAVLADPRAAHPDVVLVGGDTVPGPFARATLARLDSLGVPVHSSKICRAAERAGVDARRRRRRSAYDDDPAVRRGDPDVSADLGHPGDARLRQLDLAAPAAGVGVETDEPVGLDAPG
jgi:hypothetical protein